MSCQTWSKIYAERKLIALVFFILALLCFFGMGFEALK
jgi:hypothetical protein